jgi:valyl-tRNA synthetase
LLGERTDDLCVRQFAAPGHPDHSILEQGALLKEAITAIRDARNKAQLKPKELIQLYIQSDAESTYEAIVEILSKQVNAPSILFTHEIVPASLVVALGKHKFYLKSELAVDTGKQEEEMRKELRYLIGFRESIDKKLSNEKFVQNAKPEVVDFERKKMADAEEKIKVLQESLSGAE